MKLSEVLLLSLEQRGLYSFFVKKEDIDFIKSLECSDDTSEEIKRWLSVFAAAIVKTENQPFELNGLPVFAEMKALFLSRPRLKHLNNSQVCIDYILPGDFSLYLLDLKEEGDSSEYSSDDFAGESSFQETTLFHIFNYMNEKFGFNGLWDYFCRRKEWLEGRFEVKKSRYNEASAPSFNLSMRYACLEIEKKMVFDIIRDYNSGLLPVVEIRKDKLENAISSIIKRKNSQPNFMAELITNSLPIEGNDEEDRRHFYQHENLEHKDSIFKGFKVSDLRAICDEIKLKCMSNLINEECKKSSAKNLRDFLQFAEFEAFCFTAAVFLLYKTPIENWKNLLFLSKKDVDQAFYDFDNGVYGIIADVFKHEKELTDFCVKPCPIFIQKRLSEYTEKVLESFLMACFTNSRLRFSFFIALHSIVLQSAPYLIEEMAEEEMAERLPKYMASKENLKLIPEIVQYFPDFGRSLFPKQLPEGLLGPLAKFREELNREGVKKILLDFVGELLEEHYANK